MPITLPTLDERKYQELLDEALARIPVHNPEWTNFNKSDPGVTLIEVFAFLTENLLYRANQVPERNRRKFLSLLGIPFQPAASAQGLVTFANERGALSTVTLNRSLEVRAGQVPYRTTLGLDVLPVEARLYYKKERLATSQEIAYYIQLYQSFLADPPDLTSLKLYETAPMPDPLPGSQGVDLGNASVVDGIWIALLVRAADKPYTDAVDLARQAIGGKTLSLGVVPWLPDAARSLEPVGQVAAEAPRLQFEIPRSGKLPDSRIPTYRPLPAEASVDVLKTPGIVQVGLPEAPALKMWSNLDPLEMGVGKFPPALEDTNLFERLITWIHVIAPHGVPARLYWLGINAAPITQGAAVTNERLPDGSGEPEQVITLARSPVIPGSVTLRVTRDNQVSTWEEVEDLISAGPEVPAADPRLPPGVQPPLAGRAEVFQLDAESGQLRFGDGTHGKRPPLGASLRADYTYSQGSAGNVGAGSVSSGPSLPAGFKVTNPLPTWGGVDAETQAEAEKQIARYLQHRDRLVTVEDFKTITWRAPGADIGRVEVLPAYHPELSDEPGEAPGMVTLMVIPRYDADQPDAPVPDQTFLKAICDYLDTRRLVTTEVHLRGPNYQPIWVSIGVQSQPGWSAAELRESVKSAIRQFISPLPPNPGSLPVDEAISGYASGPHGWPLRKQVVDLELGAVASRVPGVLSVKGVYIQKEGEPFQANTPIVMEKLELPRLAGISVVVGDPLSMDQLGVPDGTPETGSDQPPPVPSTTQPLPVPVIPEECR